MPYNPKNPNTTLTNITALGLHYDQNATDAYQFFNKSLQQVPCNTSSTAQYSLARNCDDCADAYKQWLCAVIIPRCQDYTNDASYLQPRAVNTPFVNQTLAGMVQGGPEFGMKNMTYYNASRNPMIDSDISPGPYKEILPCKEVCYNLVQSCPALLQFACPLPNFGLNWTYGDLDTSLPPGEYSCNAMAVRINGAPALRGRRMVAMMMAASATLVVMAV